MFLFRDAKFHSREFRVSPQKSALEVPLSKAKIDQ